MTGSDDSITIYNATDGPLPIDRAGRMLAARESDTVSTLEGLSGHIESDRIVLVESSSDADESTIVDDDTPTPTTRTRKGRASTQEA